MRQEEQVARMQSEMYTLLWLGNLNGGDLVTEGSTEDTIIFRWTLKKQGNVWTGSVWLRVGTSGRKL
jgi:hypothetical protein